MFGKKKQKDEAGPEDEAAPAVEGEGEAAPAKKKLSGKALVLFVILPAILVLGAGGGAAFLLLGQGGGEQHAEAETGGHAKAKAKGGHGAGPPGEPVPGPSGTTITQGEDVIFVALPEMLVNIVGHDGRPAYLKLRLTLEAPDQAAVTALTEHIPRVSDQFNGFLREMRTDDLAGSAGAYRLRLELLRRVNLVIAPAQVNAVLIEEMLVQ
ncbi:MAG: flagellar basal body-associated FliL family protein [Terricaulis sp.]|nr:flagellar basal body-associated FliL family protein [Terricaulis sp.]